MPDHNEYDPTVLTDLQRGDPAAWTAFYNDFAKVLYQYTRKIITDRAIAKDVVSEVFESCWVRREHLSTIHDYKAYLYVAARNRSIDYLRHEQMKQKHNRHIMDNVYGEPEENLSVKMSAQTALTEIISQLHKEIINLPARESQVARMIYIEGKSTKEVAEDLSLSPQTIRNISSTVVRKMRYKLPFHTITLLLFLYRLIRLADHL